MRIWGASTYLVAAALAAAAISLVASGAVSSDANSMTIVLASAALNLALAVFAWNRHRAFAQMREAQQAFRDLYENISEGVFRTTLDAKCSAPIPRLCASTATKPSAR